MRPEVKVIAQRYARHLCVKEFILKWRKFGRAWVEIVLVYNPDWEADSERAVVDEALREEQIKRGLR